MKRIADPGRVATYGIVFSIGFFGLAAQTLLFRDFLTVFEGNELGIALFFCSWLLWVAVGALLGRVQGLTTDFTRNYFEFLPLLYIPAFVLQEWLINNARGFADVKPYELFPLAKMIPFALLAMAPVSLCSGWFFTRACQWISAHQPMPVSRVYILEAIGSFAGGVVVTLLLGFGAAGENVSLAAALLLALALFHYRLRGRAYITAGLPLLVILTVYLAGLGHVLERAHNLRSWQRLLPAESYRGNFTTPQARYLYGDYHGQINIVAWESVRESIPNAEHASEVIALHLAQYPQAGKFLVIGPGSFSICRRLLDLPQAEIITWLDPDPAYPGRLLNVLPKPLLVGVDRLEIPSIDIRRHLAASARKYDIVILNLPSVTTLALNRYFTREFFLRVKEHLAESGVLGVRVTAGENYMGDELVNAGATVFCTLSSVFKNLALKPGEESWLLASEGGGLSASPAVLRDRFGAIQGAAGLYPPEGLLALYLPDRIGYQMDYYRNTVKKASGELLLNTDRHPKALLHSLLFAAREAGTALSLTSTIRALALSGMILAPLAMGLYGLLRWVYLWKRRARPPMPPRREETGIRTAGRSFDDFFLVFSAGAVSMGLIIVLMFTYQSVYGSLFLYVGLISALFMLGISLGSLVSQSLLAGGKPGISAYLLPLGIIFFALLTAVIRSLPSELNQAVFIALFLVSGLLGGIFVPVVAARWNAAGLPPAPAGAMIEFNDHLGGMCGGLIIGLILLPMFGSAYTLGVMALFLLVNLAPWPFRGRGIVSPADRFESWTRAAGYVMLGLGVFCMAVALIFRFSERDALIRSFNVSAEALRGELERVPQRVALKDGRTLDYLALRDTGGTNQACIFSTEKLAADINGYGGPILFAVRMSAEGKLEGFRIIESNETPAYLDLLAAWFQKLVGKKLYGRGALEGVDAVTGATLTSAAAIRILRKSGQSFARQALGLDVEESCPEIRSAWPSARFFVFAGLVAAALILRARPSRWGRRLFLLLVVAALGVVLNVQYSLAHIFSAVGLRLPSPAWNEVFLLIVILPVLALLFGNIYCGYLCPFGALQELIGDLGPRALRADPEKQIWRYGRFTKFVMLFMLILWFATTLSPALASHDPLTTVFSRSLTIFVAALVAANLVLSLFFSRFWCRNLCPTGAFLSLLNGVQLLKPLIPDIIPKACAFGVTDSRELDCLCCDRCRMAPAQESAAPAVNTRHTLLFLLAVAALALVCLHKGFETWQEERAGLTAMRSGIVTGGSSRAVDIRRIKFLIEQHSLSGHEATHYKAVGSSREK